MEDVQPASGFGGQLWNVASGEIVAESETQEFEWLNFFEKVVEKGDGTVCGPLGEGKIKIEIEIDISICYG